MVYNGKVDFLRYPLAAESDYDTIVFDEVDMKVYATDTFLCTEKLKGSQLLESGANENIFSLLYKEQFVVSFEATIKQNAKAEDIDNFKSIVQNILQNADVGGVNLLSVAFDKDAGVLPFSPTDLIPTKASTTPSYQPLKLPFVRVNNTLSIHDRGWTNKNADLSHGCLERDMLERMEGDFVSFSCLDNDNVELEATRIASEDGTLRINTTYICGVETINKPALLTDANNNPVWVISIIEGAEKDHDSKQNLLLSRVIALPSKNDIETTFKSQSDYPVMPMFGDYFGADINYLLLAMKGSNIASWIEYGMECNRDVMADGTVEYEVYLADDMGGQSACFVGCFEKMNEFLSRVESEAFLEDQDAPFEIAEDMGCSPIGTEHYNDELMD